MSRTFRKWVDEYQDQAWTLARYLLKDPSEAEDACQEAFVKLWHNRDSIDPDKIRPWLMKVTRNGCLDRLRRRHPTEELQEWHMPDVVSGPAQGLQQERCAGAGGRRVALLPEHGPRFCEGPQGEAVPGAHDLVVASRADPAGPRVQRHRLEWSGFPRKTRSRRGWRTSGGNAPAAG